jgi:hypothetical protein
MTAETRILLDKAAKARDSRIVVVTEQDVEPILDHNSALRAMPQRSDWGRHVASIPVVELTRWLNEEWARGNTSIRWGSAEFDELIRRKIYDRDNIKLRVDDKSNGMLGWR